MLTSLLMVLEVPPVSLGWVIATIGHGLIKSRLDSMYSGKLKIDMININNTDFFNQCYTNLSFTELQ